MSPPEVRMWAVLRRPPFKVHHFRRQVQLGPFYADFASHAARLVIEIDGASHFHDGEMQYDIARDDFMAGEGYAVARFTTSEVLNDLQGVAAAILAHLPPPVSALPSHPPHEGEGGAHPKAPKAG